MRVRIGVWMTLQSLGLVLLVATGVAASGFSLFQRLARESVVARVRLAAIGAAEGIEVHAADALTGARLLAERPTLRRMLQTSAQDDLRGFLEQFRATSELDGCAVLSSDGVLVASAGEVDWAAIAEFASASPRRGLSYLAAADDDSVPLAVAVVSMIGDGAGTTVAARRLDGALAEELGRKLDLAVRIRSGPPSAALHELGADGTWHAHQLVSDPDGTSSVSVEVALSADQAMAALRPVQRTFALVTLGAGALAVLVGLLVARRLSRPLTVLRAAAERIGAGDLTTPMPQVGGVEVGALAATMEDMRSRLHSTTAELSHREAEANALLTGIVEGVFAVDGERRVQSMNPQAAAYLGVEASEVLGRFCGDLLRPETRDGARPCDHDCPIVHARSRGSSRAVEHLQLPGGRRAMILTSAPPVGSRQVQVMRDETDLEAARRARDAILANVSHELKTPLTAQLASIELLQTELAGVAPPAAAELVTSLERSTLRLTRLIDNLLESVRIETGLPARRHVAVEIAAIVDEARAMTQPLLDQRRQALSVALPEAIVECDPVQLTQVFVNLLSNANKFAPEGTRVHIGGACGDGVLTVWVEDQGAGLHGGAAATVFDRFSRLDAGTEGIGLGLWIVKSIVTRHGGHVAVEASSTGGARFTVTLPTGGTA